jgi:hypothetical protein
MMKNFKLKVKFEGHTVAEEEANNIRDFDPIMSGLKEKFDGPKSRGRPKHG